MMREDTTDETRHSRPFGVHLVIAGWRVLVFLFKLDPVRLHASRIHAGGYNIIVGVCMDQTPIFISLQKKLQRSVSRSETQDSLLSHYCP